MINIRGLQEVGLGLLRVILGVFDYGGKKGNWLAYKKGFTQDCGGSIGNSENTFIAIGGSQNLSSFG